MASSANGGKREVVRTLYKDLVHAARLLEPQSHSAEALTTIRSSFKQNLGVADAAQIDELIKEGRNRLGYVRTIVPLTSRRKMKNFGGRFIVDSKGQVVRGTAAGEKRTKWDQDNHFLDPDHLARHEYLLRRQHFLEKPPPHIMEKFYKGE
jgi:hypothetical protein